MQVVIIFPPSSNELLTLAGSRPVALLNLAGHTLLSHVLTQLWDVILTATELIFVEETPSDSLKHWLKGYAVGRPYHLTSLEELPNYLRPGGPVYVTSGHSIVFAPLSQIAESTAQAAVVVKPNSPAGRYGAVVDPLKQENLAATGSFWVKQGKLLDEISTSWLNIEQLLPLLPPAQLITANKWLDVETPAGLLAANKALLGVNFGSQEAIERSYIDGFAVVPPVYLHPDAEIEASVIGPYASISAGAVLKNAIVRHSIVAEGAVVEDSLLENSYIGENNQVAGTFQTFLVNKDGE